MINNYVQDKFGQKLNKGDFAVVFSTIEAEVFLTEIIEIDSEGNLDLMVHNMHDDDQKSRYNMNVSELIIVKYPTKLSKKLLIREELSRDD